MSRHNCEPNPSPVRDCYMLRYCGKVGLENWRNCKAGRALAREPIAGIWSGTPAVSTTEPLIKGSAAKSPEDESRLALRRPKSAHRLPHVMIEPISRSRVTGSPGQRFWPGRVGSRVSVPDPEFDPVLSLNMRLYGGVVSTE